MQAITSRTLNDLNRAQQRLEALIERPPIFQRSQRIAQASEQLREAWWRHLQSCRATGERCPPPPNVYETDGCSLVDLLPSLGVSLCFVCGVALLPLVVGVLLVWWRFVFSLFG